MQDWRKWPERARAAKRQSTKSDADLAAAVSEATNRKAGRAQVNHWFTGKREPTLSQFMALCEEMGADPGAILFGVPALSGDLVGSAKAALEADPTKKPSYAMQEKRLALHKRPSRLRVGRKKRAKAPA